MDVRQQKKLREDFLVTLLEMHDGNFSSDKNTEELCKKLGLDYNTNCSAIALPLHQDGLVSWGAGFAWISLTPKGRHEAERIVESRYAVKAQRVLQKIYDMSKGIPGEIVAFDSLVKELGMSDDEVTGICIGLEEECFIKWPGGDVVEITARGCRAIDDGGKQQRTGGDVYNTHIDTLHGGAQIGSRNVQNINITNNAEFDQAIAGLLQLIQGSRLPNDEIEELRDEVNKLNKFALSEPKADSLEKAKFRIDKVKLSFETAKLLVQAAPHLQTAWEYLKVHFG